MTKKSISRLLQASLMCCLAVLFTACDDIFASEDNPTPAYLSMSEAPVTLKAGDTYRRKAISVTTAVVEYTSSDTKVATVDGEGMVAAIAEGTATITATATGYSTGGKKIYQPASVSYVVTVTPATVAVTGLTLNKANLRFGMNAPTAQALTADVLPADATDKTVTWTSSDPTVATVDASGNVTPVAKGTVTITAKAGDQTATSSVYVYDKIHNINTEGAAAVGADKSWLIEGTGTAVDNAIYIGTDATVTLNGINITQQIDCSGDANIILADGSTNTVTVSTANKAGIKIGNGATTTLTINGETAGDGKLTVQGGSNAAGIGTNGESAGGNIVINGGTVTAEGGFAAAGIGTGLADLLSTNTCGTITINGGTVTATGGDYAAGIGTGVANNWSNTCGAITINGGTVTATGGDNAAGIGTGWSYSATNTCGAITIGTGVTSVTATKGAGSPNSIGTGTKGVAQNCGTITFGTAQVFDGTAATGTWSPSPMVADNYGGLTLAISATAAPNDTWTLTPVAP